MESESTKIRLWDGVPRDPEMVEKQFPGLLDYWRTHPVLEETAYRPEYVECTPAILLAAFIGLAGVVGLWWWLPAPPKSATIPFTWIFSAGILLLTGIAITWLHLRNRRNAIPFWTHVVRIENECVHVVSPNGNALFRFKDVSWCRGFMWQQGERMPSFFGRRCVILRLKSGKGLSLQSRRVACGMTKETYPVWTDFLTLAGLLEERPQIRFPRTLTCLGVVLGLFLSNLIYSWLKYLLLPVGLKAALIMQTWLFVPLLAGLYASFLAGNDWVFCERPRSYLTMFVFFATAAVVPAGIVGDGNLAVTCLWVLAGGTLGVLAGVPLAWRSQTLIKRQQAA